MAGLPRSGSTLLSAILNQNPDIEVTATTDTISLMLALDSTSQASQPFRAGFEPEGYRNVMARVPHSFYSHINKPYIIDKNRNWGTPNHLKLANMITDNIKIIAPVRPILEILASFVNLTENDSNNFIDSLVSEYPVSEYRSKNDAKCDVLMAANRQIEKNTLSIASSLIPQHKDKFHFVAYADLVSKPERVVDAIYKFLDIPKFAHYYENLRWELLPNESEVYGIPNLHKIRSKIGPSKTDISVLSDYVKQKYSHHLDFIFPNGIKDFV